MSPKAIQRLCRYMNRISNLTRHRESAGFDTCDIDQVSDQSVHPSRGALNALSVQEHLFHVTVPRNHLRDERREGYDRRQHIP